MTSSQVYNKEMIETNELIILAESDNSRFGVFAVMSQKIQHVKGTLRLKKTYYIEALELQDTFGDGEYMPTAIDYVEFKSKAELLKAFKNYSIK